MYHLPRNVIYVTVGLVYINLQTEYELPSLTRFGQFRKLKNWSWGHQPTLRKKVLHGVRALVHGYLRVRFDLPSSINFSDISGFPKLGPIILIRGHPRGSRVVPLDSTDMISY